MTIRVFDVIKARSTEVMKRALESSGQDIVGPGWGFEVTEPHPNVLQIKVTAPAGQSRYYFEVKTKQILT